MTPPEDKGTTYFAEPGRADAAVVAEQVALLAAHPIVSCLLRLVDGMVAVLNEQRQIVAVNDALLRAADLGDVAAALGLRPGEALGCVHAGELSGGCGTSRFCSTCGTGRAIVAALRSGEPQEQMCALTVRQGDLDVDRCLRVRACREELAGAPYVVLFAQDVTETEWHAALERNFFVDLQQIVHGTRGLLDLPPGENPAQREEILRLVRAQIEHLSQEMAIQHALSHEWRNEYAPVLSEVRLPALLTDLRDLHQRHPAARGRALALPPHIPVLTLSIDRPLLLRVLSLMLVNALEATPPGGTVRIGVQRDELERCVLSVWNVGAIPAAEALRVFQRHFSTKPGAGRGLGTYTIKLLGETLLGGRVSFSSTAADGTTFRIALPAAAVLPEAPDAPRGA